MSARTVSILVLGGALAAGLTACGSTSTATSPPAAAAASTAVTPPSAKPVQVPTSEGPDSPAGSAGCPVTVKTLLAVLRARHDKLPTDLELRGVQCYRDYAITGTFSTRSDSEVETFRFVSGSWQYFVGGSDSYCEGVPANVTKHFRGMGYPGCS